MKVLYIGHYKDGTGWGNAAVNNILALHKAGVDVIPRAVTYNNQDSDYPETIKKLELRSSYGCDICIQHVLPHLYNYSSKYKKNIGYLATETTSFKDTGWQHHCNIMDQIWVPSSASKASCRLSGVKCDIRVVPHSLDIQSYILSQSDKQIQELQGTFNFVFIGEFIERKNIQALLKAFHSEFDTMEPVNLFIKTSRKDLAYVDNYCEQVKMGLKLRKNYKKEIVISGRLEQQDYMSVLRQCHAFVMPSRGEGFCIPALESMALGLPVISTLNTGLDDFASGVKVESHKTPCFGAVDTLPHLDSANSEWYEINYNQLKFAMRSLYMKHICGELQEQSDQAVDKAKQYDHIVIGQKMKEILNDN